MFVSDGSKQEKYNYLHMFKMDALRILLLCPSSVSVPLGGVRQACSLECSENQTEVFQLEQVFFMYSVL
jgi:hypothetical protein